MSYYSMRDIDTALFLIPMQCLGNYSLLIYTSEQNIKKRANDKCRNLAKEV